MVKQLFIEGDKQLRPGFSQLLQQKVRGNRFKLNLEGPDSEATYKFYHPDTSEHKFLVVDLDGNQETRNRRLSNLKIKAKDANRVFFMVQKMESWFLSQPEVIKDCFNLQNTPTVPRKAIEIEQPDQYLANLVRPKKYHKVKDAATMLPKLNLTKLEAEFEDVQQLIATLLK
ncbi:MAG: DUF4276 family protein [Chitinophagales bacterium]